MGGKRASKATKKVLDLALGKIVGEGMEAAGDAASKSFFDGTSYTNKILGQIKKGDYLAFPESVKAFECFGIVSTITGGDGVIRQLLKIPRGNGERRVFLSLLNRLMVQLIIDYLI